MLKYLRKINSNRAETIRKIKVVISFIVAIPLAVLLLFSLDYTVSGTISNMMANIYYIIKWLF